jgi:bifunctional UDP-N-acetylglucosamine pyrophosphorylase/glucosamine-1-phosphate N-acetyltransferase
VSIRDGDRLVEIVEHADATPAQRAIREVWLLATVFRREDLFRTLPAVGDDNRQREFYLNSVFPILLDKGEAIAAVTVDTGGVMGLNSRNGLAAVTRVVRERINAMHMANGVTLLDPDTTYIDVGVTIGAETTILPNTTIQGDTHIGKECRIGPNVQIVDTPRSATARRSGSRSSRGRRSSATSPSARSRGSVPARRSPTT